MIYIPITENKLIGNSNAEIQTMYILASEFQFDHDIVEELRRHKSPKKGSWEQTKRGRYPTILPLLETLYCDVYSSTTKMEMANIHRFVNLKPHFPLNNLDFHHIVNISGCVCFLFIRLGLNVASTHQNKSYRDSETEKKVETQERKQKVGNDRNRTAKTKNKHN